MLFRGQKLAYSLYGVTIFLSAFLLFVIQPIAGKHLLPYFGGSSSVWAVSLVFFTTLLFLGYLYVYLLTILQRRAQMVIHLALIGVALCGVGAALWLRDSAALGTLALGGNPWRDVLLALSLSIGLPYFLLSTTGPLVQYWYGIAEGKEPYILYALSNIGSLAALVSYPFLIEPLFRLSNQESWWVAGFLVFAILLVALCMRSDKAAMLPIVTSRAPRISTVLFWLTYSALPSFALVATTTQITQTIAPVPLLWIAPLTLYLLTFILAFSGRGRSMLVPFIVLVTAGIAYWILDIALGPFYLFKLVADAALLFAAGLMCHAALYRTRPETAGLPFFYLVISLGGMCGALAAGMFAPLVFKDFWEFSLAILFTSALAFSFVIHRWLGGKSKIAAYILQAAVVFALICASFLYARDHHKNIVYSSRNFYGMAQVLSVPAGRVLMHGATIHGLQLSNPDMEFQPTSYYTRSSGVGRALVAAHLMHPDRGLRVGIVGLGTGTIASYCADKDTFVFYEIDPSIVLIAQNQFTYLSSCKNVEIRVGDGRSVLADEFKEGKLGKYDVFVMDAFSNDTVPVHLLTKEAFQLYLSHLRDPDSIIVINISNRYLELGRILMRLARELNLASILTFSHVPASEPFGYNSQWVILAKEPKMFRAEVFNDITVPYPQDPAALWTDDYSNILSALWIPDISQMAGWWRK